MASRTAYSTWTPQKPTLFDGHYLRNRSSLDIGVLGYIGIVQHKEHSPEVLSIPPGTPCISLLYKPRVSNTWPLNSFYTYLLLMLRRLQYVVTLIVEIILTFLSRVRRLKNVCRCTTFNMQNTSAETAMPLTLMCNNYNIFFFCS